MSASQRRKGANGEREVCSLLASEFGTTVKRTLGQARDSGTDIQIGNWSIEVKRRRSMPTIYGWMDQAATGNGIPAVMVRADGEDWLVVMRWKDWAKLAREDVAK